MCDVLTPLNAAGNNDESKRLWVMEDLKCSSTTKFHCIIVTICFRTTLDGLVVKLFGDVQRRWLETTFPFTHPSLEAEIFFKGAWLEVRR